MTCSRHDWNTFRYHAIRKHYCQPDLKSQVVLAECPRFSTTFHNAAHWCLTRLIFATQQGRTTHRAVLLVCLEYHLWKYTFRKKSVGCFPCTCPVISSSVCSSSQWCKCCCNVAFALPSLNCSDLWNSLKSKTPASCRCCDVLSVKEAFLKAKQCQKGLKLDVLIWFERI